MLVAIGNDWCQTFDLVARLEDRFVGSREICEVGEHLGDAILDRERLKHVVSNKVGKVADLLHRHGLQEQIQRLVASDTETAAESSPVRWEAVEQCNVAALFEFLLQFGDVAIKA